MRWVIMADELSALGWRLAGAQPLIAAEPNLRERFAEAQRDADLILLTADLARHLAGSVLDAALLAEKPLIALISSLPAGGDPPDLDQQVKRVLGIAV